MRKILSYILPAIILMPSIAFAGDLQANDLVGVTFWIISIAMVAATAFFIIERSRVSPKWQTSLSVISLVTLIAAVHYFYMREVWVDTGASPTVFRYIDWLLTVPLQMIEFYLILAAVTAVSAGVFYRLLVGTLVMLVAGMLVRLALSMQHSDLLLVWLDGYTFYMKSFPVKLGKLVKLSAHQ